MTAKDDLLRIAVNLEGNVKKQFLEVRKVLGIRSYTDVLRFLITDYYRKKAQAKNAE